MELLRVENLSKTYGGNTATVNALLPCSFSICQSEKIAITGPSGSGKSTLLHLLGGLDSPTAGSVFYNNTDLYPLDDDGRSAFRRRNIGFVFQSYNLVPELTAYENILLPLWIDRQKVDQEYLNGIVDALNLKDRLRHLPGELSGGQQQRVAIARALICKPSLILCDEPTGNLDSENSKEVIHLLWNVSVQYKAALVIVTHDAQIAGKMERQITISDGILGGDIS